MRSGNLLFNSCCAYNHIPLTRLRGVLGLEDFMSISSRVSCELVFTSDCDGRTEPKPTEDDRIILEVLNLKVNLPFKKGFIELGKLRLGQVKYFIRFKKERMEIDAYDFSNDHINYPHY